ncbi:deoxyribonuclease IV [Candidatus Parcubacteria bacterium]|nr:deoxyribonuclease IV [Candidatus Parcubacteria bacterium]
MKFGVHVSAAGGIQHVPEHAHRLGCACFQLFSRSPRGGRQALTDEMIQGFRRGCREFGYAAEDIVIHAPYYINLASPNRRIQKNSVRIVREELERADVLGIGYVVTHLGSAMDRPETEGRKNAAASLAEIMRGWNGESRLLLEFSAGTGAIIGDTFEEVGDIMAKSGHDFGVCLDTCHMFASGYDVRTPAAVKAMLADFDRHLGLERLKIVHANDSVFGLGSHRDRHADIGKGEIGEAGFRALLGFSELRKVNWILETPKDSDEDDLRNLSVIQKIAETVGG